MQLSLVHLYLLANNINQIFPQLTESITDIHSELPTIQEYQQSLQRVSDYYRADRLEKLSVSSILITRQVKVQRDITHSLHLKI